MNGPALSLQLYSLRLETAVDPAAVLRQVPSLGFDGVELAGDYGWTADQWQDNLRTAGLSVVGTHVGLETLEKDLETHWTFATALDCQRVIVPALPKSLQTKDGYAEGARRLNALGASLRDHGGSLFYHNHAFEFSDLGGARGIDILLCETDPQLVAFEIDTYWVERAGEKSLDFIKVQTPRIGMIHAKELRKSDNADVPAGEGQVPFAEIIPHARQHSWPIVVEYEGGDALNVVKKSAEYLRTIPGF